MKIDLKYGKEKLTLDLPNDKIQSIVEPEFIDPSAQPEKIIRDSLKESSQGKTISEIIRSSTSDPSVTVSLEDHTRPVPTAPIVNAVTEELIESGVSKEDITFLVATGIHRDLKPTELEGLREIVGPEPEIANHHADVESEQIPVGELTYPDGTTKELSINRYLVSADISILTGDVEFHQLFGYGGGAKSVLPGTADAESVRFNHSLLDLKGARSGNLKNPLRQAAERAADKADIDYSVNLVLNPDKKVVDCYSGDVHKSFNQAVEKVDEYYKVPFKKRTEFVIVEAGGYPKDIDLYQAQKAVENALKMAQPGAEIALIAKCPDGWGSETFHNWVRKTEEISDTISRIQDNFIIGGHKAYIYAKEKSQAKLYLVSDLEQDRDLKKIFNPISRKTLEEKAKSAESVSVLKLGSSTLPVKYEKSTET